MELGDTDQISLQCHGSTWQLHVADSGGEAPVDNSPGIWIDSIRQIVNLRSIADKDVYVRSHSKSTIVSTEAVIETEDS